MFKLLSSGINGSNNGNIDVRWCFCCYLFFKLLVCYRLFFEFYSSQSNALPEIWVSSVRKYDYLVCLLSFVVVDKQIQCMINHLSFQQLSVSTYGIL